jgi:predicted Zn-dependent protease
MSASRIEVFKSMLESDPANTMVLFGLANEYLKAENYTQAIPVLENYLNQADDEGAAWGMLAKAYEKQGEREKAKAALMRGVEVANLHGHPSMAADYGETLEFDYAD